MKIEDQIEALIISQPEDKRNDMRELHRIILQAMPACRLWYDDGKDAENKTVANPTIGYGFQVIRYANGKTRDFFQVGLSANKTGFSVYILGIEDKTYLSRTYGEALGKAKVTGYCIRFKALKDIDVAVLSAAIRYGVAVSGEKGEG